MPKLYRLVENNTIQTLLDVLGYESDLHLVGGCIRDAFLNIEAKDIDLATKLTPEQVINKLDKANIKYIPTGIRRGTITCLINNEPIEITTFRNPSNETQYTSSILEDLPARDFTINAIAYSLNNRELIDPFNGIHDLQNNLLKCVGDPRKRFTDDPYRVLRMIRFGIAAGRKTDSLTYQTAEELAPLLQKVSIERVNAELVKIICSKYVSNAFLLLSDLGILQLFIPELDLCNGFEQNKYHLFDVLNHTLYVTAHVPQEKIVRLAALFHDIGKPTSLTVDELGNRRFIGHESKSVEITTKIMSRLKFSTEDIKLVSLLVQTHMIPIVCGRKCIRKLISQLGNQLDRWLQLKYADIFSSKPLDRETGDRFKREWDEFYINLEKELCYKSIVKFDQLSVNGYDLLERGMTEGPMIGKILNELKDLVLEDPSLNTKELLLERINLTKV